MVIIYLEIITAFIDDMNDRMKSQDIIDGIGLYILSLVVTMTSMV